jgi:hypothetical protein
MPATTYFEGLIFGHALLQKPFSIEKWYVGLFKADPTVAGLLTQEVNAADYARKSVLWNTSFTNSNQIDWAAPTVNWGDITYVALLNSPNPGSGNMLCFEALAATFPMPIGQPAKIAPGNLTLDL